MPVAVIDAPSPTDSANDLGWNVILFNCDCHTFDQVESILIKAISCSLSQARSWSWEIHSKGSAVVYRGEVEHCEAIADVIASTGLQVRIAQ